MQSLAAELPEVLRTAVMLLEEVDDRLKEWAHYFRDRARLSTCGSAERLYRPHSDDYAVEGWGDPPAVPKAPQKRNLLRAIEVNEALVKIPVVNRWALTYGFAYGHLPRFVLLRGMKRRTRRRMSWKEFLEAVDIGKVRVWRVLSE